MGNVTEQIENLQPMRGPWNSRRRNYKIKVLLNISLIAIAQSPIAQCAPPPLLMFSWSHFDIKKEKYHWKLNF